MATETWKLNWSKLIVLNSENVNALKDDLEGVYRVSKLEGDRAIVFFVGSGSIKQQLLLHLNDATNECVKSTIQSYRCYFRYSVISEDRVKKAAERKLYKVYAPQCNSVTPEGSDDISINLD